MMLSVRIFTALSAASAVIESISASFFLLFDHAPTSPPMPPPPIRARMTALQNSTEPNNCWNGDIPFPSLFWKTHTFVPVG